MTAVSPTSGPAAGGNAVTITGTGFTGATSISFGATNLSSGFTVKSASEIDVAAAPAGTNVVDVTVTTPDGTSATSAADDYTYYALQVVNGTTTKTYTLAQIEAMTAVSGYGEFLNTYPRFVDQGELTGVSVLNLLAGVGGLTPGQSVKITASDGYTRTFTYDQVKNNNFTMYDPTSDAAHPTVITSIADPPLQFVIAYEQNGGPISDDAGGPLRTAFVSPVAGEQATDSVNWVKYVVKIEVL